MLSLPWEDSGMLYGAHPVRHRRPSADECAALEMVARRACFQRAVGTKGRPSTATADTMRERREIPEVQAVKNHNNMTLASPRTVPSSARRAAAAAGAQPSLP